MTLRDWVSDSTQLVREQGLYGAERSIKRFYQGGLRRLNPIYDSGTPVFSLDWDVMLVLDACRVDLMRELTGEYDFIEKVGTLRSVGSSSGEWMRHNFTSEFLSAMSETAYVCANVHTHGNDAVDAFGYLDEVWRYGWEEAYQTIPAETVTDRTIAVGRESNHNRMLVHYMQPHHPFVESDLEDAPAGRPGDDLNKMSVWNHLEAGHVDRTTVWEAYLDNLRYVLDQVETVLENVDADTVLITSDHGNAMGEWGVYGHPSGLPLSVLREVPLVEASATDSGDYEPTVEPEGVGEQAPQDKLRALGYVD